MSFEDNQIVKWIAMADIKVKRSLAARTLDRVKARVCLICNCEKAPVRRGLCDAHYLQFYRMKMRLPKRERPAFEQHNIEAGRILAAGQVRDLHIENPFLDSDSA